MNRSGEIAAAYTAGFTTLQQAITIAYYRGLVLSQEVDVSSKKTTQGAMCAVGVGEIEAGKLLDGVKGRIQLAAVNSPSSCTLSGDRDAVEELVDRCKKQGRFCRKLRVDVGVFLISLKFGMLDALLTYVAYHSHQMIPLAEKYLEALQRLGLSSQPKEVGKHCQMFSSVTGSKISPEDCTPEYWSRNMTSTVRFFPAIRKCTDYMREFVTLLEIGPHPALKGPLNECFRESGKADTEYHYTCSRGSNDFEAILESVGSMPVQGAPLELSKINARESIKDSRCRHEYGKVLTDLPSYQWNHNASFWAESRVSHNVRFRQSPRHQLLGSRYVDDIPQRPCWRNHLILKEVPWLARMKVSKGLSCIRRKLLSVCLG